MCCCCCRSCCCSCSNSIFQTRDSRSKRAQPLPLRTNEYQSKLQTWKTFSLHDLMDCSNLEILYSFFLSLRLSFKNQFNLCCPLRITFVWYQIENESLAIEKPQVTLTWLIVLSSWDPQREFDRMHLGRASYWLIRDSGGPLLVPATDIISAVRNE